MFGFNVETGEWRRFGRLAVATMDHRGMVMAGDALIIVVSCPGVCWSVRIESDRPATPSDKIQDPSDFELMFERAPVGMCCFDTDLRYVHINAALAAINGRSISDHIGFTLREVLPEIAPTL